MNLPPGVIYLIIRLPKLVLPPALVYALNRICDFAFGVSLPPWSRVPTYILSFPILLTCSMIATNYRDRRQAALRGAVLPPMYPSRWPGGLDILAALVQNFKTGYSMGLSIKQLYFLFFMDTVAGDVMDEQCNTLGHTINTRILFENRVCTSFKPFLCLYLLTLRIDLHR